MPCVVFRVHPTMHKNRPKCAWVCMGVVTHYWPLLADDGTALTHLLHTQGQTEHVQAAILDDG